MNSGMLTLAKLLLVGVLTTLAPISYGQSARQVAEKAFRSVLMLSLQDSKGQPLKIGSGFFVKEDVIASNLHVIRGASSGYVKLVGEKTTYEILGVLAADEDHDLVLLSVKAINGLAISFGNTTNVAIGDEVYVVGNPLGLEGTFSAGIVSGIRKIETDTVYQITAPISPGSSGGPVLDSQGRVIGIAAATYNGGQNLNFAIPVSYLQQMALDAKAVKPLSDYCTTKKSRDVFADFGEQNQGVVGGSFTWDTRWEGGKIDYSFSLRNRLVSSVRNVRCLVIFYDKSGEPLDAQALGCPDTILPGLAKRVKKSYADESLYTAGDTKRIEIRVLDYQLVE